MKKSIIVFFLMICVIFSQTKGRSPKSKLPPVDPDAKWACHIGSFHKCQCLAMVSETEEKIIEGCLKFTGKEYNKCLNDNMSNSCDIIQKADSKHPEHTCKRTCSKPRCQCADSNPCFGFSLVENNEDH